MHLNCLKVNTNPVVRNCFNGACRGNRSRSDEKSRAECSLSSEPPSINLFQWPPRSKLQPDPGKKYPLILGFHPSFLLPRLKDILGANLRLYSRLFYASFVAGSKHSYLCWKYTNISLRKEPKIGWFALIGWDLFHREV